MSPAALFLTASALAMDASAVAATLGMRLQWRFWQGAVMCLVFGLFQAGMPCVGYLAGSGLAWLTASATIWVAAAVLIAVGVWQLHQAWQRTNSVDGDPACWPDASGLLTLAFATSVDALAAGVSLRLLEVPLAWAAGVIGGVTVVQTALALVLGRQIGKLLGNWADWIAGGILTLMGLGQLVVAAL